MGEYLLEISALNVYSQYALGFEQSSGLVGKFIARKDVLSILNLKSSKITLEDLLKLPVKRVEKYVELLSDIVRFTFEKEQANLASAINNFKIVNDQLSAALSNINNAHVILEIQGMFKDLNLVAPFRKFVRKAKMKRFIPSVSTFYFFYN